MMNYWGVTLGQWLRLCFHSRGPPVQSLVRGLRSHKPCSVAKKL